MKKTPSTTHDEIHVKAAFAEMKMSDDLKHSILIVSLTINLVVLTAWVALQITTQYDAQIASLLFSR